ncbi:MAG: hypothetical protein CL608_13075 [Anaerolineaceae bacterium]|nr:hypothetical protein [Anaerolineaceae bacterium]
MLLGCTSVPGENSPPYTLENNVLKVNLTGYKESCTEPVISVRQDDGSWQTTDNALLLPDMGMLYLNGEYNGYIACDHVVCNPLDEPYRIPLEEYRLVGERAALDEADRLVPVYETAVLTGTLKVELEFFTDETCQEPQLYTTIIDNP